MFKILKEKLNIFKKKLSEEVSSEESAGLIGKKINEKKLDEILDEFEISLLEADVAYDVAEEIRSRVREKLLGMRIKFGADPETVVENVLRDTLMELLSFSNFDLLEDIEKSSKPYVIMFLGINGTGKTTTIAKLARLIQKRGLVPVIAAADTFRAGAIEQLEYHANKLNVTLIKHQQGSDPASVAYDAIAHARAKGKHVVLIDTAGRMQTNKNLMEEMKKIKRVANPNHTIFVGDSLAGNDIINQARTFNESVGFDSIILCKVDADAKGGSAISLSFELKKPIIYVGTGQGYDDLVKFDPSFILERIFSNT
ncbi:MAG: signal recognition particle-docking protein FtsY [Thermoplasmata archaeon]|jgi:fused signal recognition particle receptor|nr:signal recognition particle-docking protein FtsY [Thermoplasmatales archaeon]PMP75052.1 MAG: signal recognition particle-docking protein FtsY [Aciduliprofundum sp.]HEU13220.1 signal recognition particle-docking protein FtsY [Euryarchaeota archaeon]